MEQLHTHPRVWSLRLLIGLLVMFAFTIVANKQAQAASLNSQVPDLSEWQGKLTATQVKNLAKVEPFIILRVQYGSDYKDKYFAHNAALCAQYGLKYGVYSFSQYISTSDAKQEAKDLYTRAPNASFYVNDYEEQTVTSGTTNSATKAWYTELHSLSPNKRILFYSYNSFAQTYAASAMKSYNGYWLADYTSIQPTGITHVLWQYTDDWYSSPIAEYVDASLKYNENTSWFLSSKAISYKKYVTENSAKPGYTIWKNLMFTSKNGTTGTSGRTYYAKYYYKHYNGSKYLSLYNKNNQWVGYVNANAMSVMTAHSYKHTATIHKSTYDVWNNFLWAKVKHYTKNYMNKQYTVKYQYFRGNGQAYYSLYKGNTWFGYVNANATLQAITTNKTVKITKKNQTIWKNLSFTKKLGSTNNYYGKTYTVKCYCNHPNGNVYYSLYIGNTWVGYINKNVVTSE
ncbi:hypothetical protein NVV78_05040 [Pediococcus ethanolidurans]|uniref:GH25 family lysozyme n=1 Tax=Pediococcus ethanolidurans TaxID=319653 RepID=UPI0021E8FED3|nr:GH25 family lysozyme [Pediococcus ethanolidurans]MCV3315309.1 hypothetical protein [Pediococcus ethanolidurans]